MKVINTKDIYFGFGYPKNEDLDALTDNQRQKILKTGKEYIRDRVSGQSSDISGRFAFQGKIKV